MTSRILSPSALLFLYASFLASALVPSDAWADELKVATGIFPYENVFSKVESALAAQENIKLVYVGDRTKMGADQIVSAVLKDEAEIGGIAGEWLEWTKIAKEKKLLTEEQIAMFTPRPCGRDVMKIVSHTGIGVGKLTMDQIQRIFTGEIKNWSEVGGLPLPVTVFVQGTHPATKAFFQKRVLKGKDLAPSHKESSDSKSLYESIAKTAGAITYSSKEIATPGLSEIELAEAVVRPITCLTKGRPSPKVRKLYDLIKF